MFDKLILEDFEKIWWTSHSPVRGKCYSHWTIYWENLQPNVYLTTYGYSSRGWSLSQKRLMQTFLDIYFPCFRKLMTGILTYSTLQSLQMEVHWNSWVIYQNYKRNWRQQLFASGYHLMQEYGCFNKYKIPPSTLETLLGHLEIGYHRWDTDQTE